RPGRFRPGWCGLPNPGVECRIDEQGQLLVGSRATMLGYFKNPARTAAVLDADGFLQTGDRGENDQEGILRLSGRMTGRLHTSDVCLCAPQPIEHERLTQPLFECARVVGQGLPHPLALLTLTEQARQRPDHEVERELEALLQRVNRERSRHEELA